MIDKISFYLTQNESRDCEPNYAIFNGKANVRLVMNEQNRVLKDLFGTH